MASAARNPIVHLELHTANLPRACSFYRELFGWRPEPQRMSCGTYMSLGLADGLDGGVVECEVERAIWIPYVEVADVAATTGRAVSLGAEVPLPPREGPAGWRSLIETPAGAEIALWQPKTR